MTQEEAFKIVSDWINNSETYQERLGKKQVAFSALYSANPQAIIDFAENIENLPPLQE